MKKLALALAILALLAPIASSKLVYTSVSATATSQTVTVNAREVLMINDGANTAYFEAFWDGETTTDATTSSAALKINESITLGKDMGVKAISFVCASGQTATVRVYAW
jgi:hypothetical protein